MSIFSRRELLLHLKSQFHLDWRGCHGIAHWVRVRANGLTLATSTGADPLVIELFAFFHDCCRHSEYTDHDHGIRGAGLARQLRNRYFELSNHQMNLLEWACQEHSDGLDTADITVMTCWDADRLDLGRAGIVPLPRHLCTEAAKDPVFLKSAHERALTWAAKQH